ncbi:MAG: hypothetical protein K5694_02250 [Bacilli bacterium]|nr:hypothetical protein [Bacilli bacterium]
MKKHPLLGLLAIPMLLTSCGADNYVGLYSFQLGKDSGTHFGVKMNLTNDDYINVDTGDSSDSSGPVGVLGKRFNLNFSIGMSKSGEDIKDDEFTALINFLKSLFPNGIDGFYQIGAVQESGRHLFKIGFASISFGTIIAAPETISEVLYSEIDSSTLTMSIPVSENDLIFQLYWYGHDFKPGKDEEGEEIYIYSKLPKEQCHPVNTHPTKAEVAAINKDDAYANAHEGVVYRDWHTLTLGLARQ